MRLRAAFAEPQGGLRGFGCADPEGDAAIRQDLRETMGGALLRQGRGRKCNGECESVHN
jgi:hypothetical protein